MSIARQFCVASSTRGAVKKWQGWNTVFFGGSGGD